MYFSAISSTQICNMLIKPKFEIKFDVQKVFTVAVFYLKSFTFKLTSWIVLTRKWHLLALPFKRLFSNHLNKDTEARSRDSITCSSFLAERYGVLSSAKFAISVSLYTRNKSAKKCWIEVVPKLSLVVPQTSQQPDYYMNY